MTGWIGVDFDGTISRYSKWEGPSGTGEPIWPMVRRVKEWLSQGIKVKIVTARVSDPDPQENALARKAIQDWCRFYIGQELEVTCCKDYAMIQLYDDRAIQVESNTGRIIGEDLVDRIEKARAG